MALGPGEPLWVCLSTIPVKLASVCREWLGDVCSHVYYSMRCAFYHHAVTISAVLHEVCCSTIGKGIGLE